MEAVVNAWIHSAVKPLVVVAKQHFRPLAMPTSSEMCLRLRVLLKWTKEAGTEEMDPEMGMLGLDQVDGESAVIEAEVEADFCAGGPPMMPPSRHLMAGDLVVKISAMLRALLGEMALRSRKYSGVCLGVGCELKAVLMRVAVETASRGGTMERM